MRKLEWLDRFMLEPYRLGEIDWRERTGYNSGGAAGRFFWRVGLLVLVAIGLPFGA